MNNYISTNYDFTNSYNLVKKSDQKVISLSNTSNAYFRKAITLSF